MIDFLNNISILHLIDHPSVLLRGSANTFKFALVRYEPFGLELIKLFLRGDIKCVVFYQGSTHAFFEQINNPESPFNVTLLNSDHITRLNVTRRLNACALNFHFAAITGIGCNASGFKYPNAPQIFINTYVQLTMNNEQ